MVCQTFNDFENRWKEKCLQIGKSELNEFQASTIAEGFLDEIMIFYDECKDKENENKEVLLMKEIFNDLNLSLQIAISNYKKRYGESIRDKIFGVKHFQIDINALKNVINQ